ncbi:SAF domain [Candidatus Sulfopaludibacter sp. SbA3]|nr:SAF domain [Candidatus Sulfopaludibacter sp. SbA3]
MGTHLAAALPEFRALPPDTLLGTMPPPGSRRTFHAAELGALAQRYGIRLDEPQDVCFEWAMAPLEHDQIVQAMRNALQDPDARIEIAETILNPVPRGRLEFPREMLGSPASPAQKDPVLWRGSVVYGGDHRYPVWTRVRVRVACDRLIATEALKPGQRVDARQMRMEHGECFPAPRGAVPALAASAAGLVPVRAIAAGAEIHPELLVPPNDVNRGDTVQVEVHSGATRLKFTAKAESGGRSGDFIAVRNPSSNRIFRARVEGKDSVLVETEFAADSR